MIWGVASSSTALFIRVSPRARMVFFCFSLRSITLLICVILIFAMLVAYLSVKYFIQVNTPLFCDRDRKSVVSGKSVSVRVDLGGRRFIKKKRHRFSSLYLEQTNNTTLNNI